MLKSYLILALAIIMETVATACLKQSEQFSRLLPSIFTVACYGVSFYCLSIVLRSMPIGIAYAIWSGLGIVLISLIGFFAFGQRLDLAAIVGLALIIASVVIINLLSGTSVH